MCLSNCRDSIVLLLMRVYTGGRWTWCTHRHIYGFLTYTDTNSHPSMVCTHNTCTNTFIHAGLHISGTEKSFQNLQKAAERAGYGGERYEQLEFQRKVARCYEVLRDASWKVILCWLWFFYLGGLEPATTWYKAIHEQILPFGFSLTCN